MRHSIRWTLVLILLLLSGVQAGEAMRPDAQDFAPGASGIAAAAPAAEEAEAAAAVRQKVAPEVRSAMDAAQGLELVPVIVTMEAQADLSVIQVEDRDERVRRVVSLLQSTATVNQGLIRAFLETQATAGNVALPQYFWVFNGLAVNASPAVIEALAHRPDVSTITPNETYLAPSFEQSTGAVETNISLIRVPSLWDLGYRGEGIVVANMDTGVYLEHPDLSAQWRGGSNSWFDPNGEHPDTPVDLNGHGTHTMGVMVGRSAGGTSIGVAPDAQWIAVKIFNDRGEATTAGIHAGFQWLLDPDGNPNTADAPHVVNNSWGSSSPGCNLDFQLDLQSLRAANILPVFSAGNLGPWSATSSSPANNPEAFAVGGTDDFDFIYDYSSRGPSDCGEPETVFPEIVAPGVGILTAERYDTYTEATGTSLAAPHVSGALALLLSAHPNLSADEQESALLNGVIDLGEAGPDNTFGHGRMDALSAYQSLPDGEPTPTLAPTATEPAATATPDPAVNLALNRPVEASSYQDEGHSPAMAVDGQASTSWQTAKAVGKKVLPAEWIRVDLGASQPVGKVRLVWDTNYAIQYSLQVSEDLSSWTTVFSTSSGNGGEDTAIFPAVDARYVMMDSTAWSSASLRNWLSEFEVFAGDGGQAPTPTSPPAATSTSTPTEPPPAATPTAAPTAAPTSTPTQALPTATATTAPTATPTPEALAQIHIGELDGSSAPGKNKRWDAAVSILVHDGNHAAVSGATVSGRWSEAITSPVTCVTDSTGWCSLTLAGLKDTTLQVTFTVEDLLLSGTAYQPAGNHDPDADSNGTSIVVTAP